MPDGFCTDCAFLLAEASRLAARARQLDEQVAHARHVGKGCATPALAILNNYDRDLSVWQNRVTNHLRSHPQLRRPEFDTADIKGSAS